MIFYRNMGKYLYNEIEHFITGAHILYGNFSQKFKLVFNNLENVKFIGWKIKHTKQKMYKTSIFSILIFPQRKWLLHYSSSPCICGDWGSRLSIIVDSNSQWQSHSHLEMGGNSLHFHSDISTWLFDVAIKKELYQSG